MNSFSKSKNLILVSSTTKTNITRIIQFLIGCFIVSLSYNIFIASNNLVPGGVGGIAVIVNNLFGIQNSTVIFVCNIFLLILSYFMLGKEKTRASILGSVIFPIFVRMTEHVNIWLQIDTSKILLSALFGGIMFGFGAGLIFKAGFTTGGTDIINQIISKYAKISKGKSMLCSDGLIVLSSAIFFGLNSILYSIMILYCISLMADKVLLGISDNKMFYIITEKEDEIKNYILKYLHHGVTIFKAKGGTKRKNENVLMTVLPTKDFYKLKEGINEIDNEAFFIVTDSYEVFGGE